MSKSILFSEQDGYLLVSISDVLITSDRAQEILTKIGEVCSQINVRVCLSFSIATVMTKKSSIKARRMWFSYSRQSAPALLYYRHPCRHK